MTKTWRTRVNGIFPKDARMLFLGQAPGSEELLEGYPFAGYAGTELDTWMKLASIKRPEVAITNVFSHPLPDTGLEGITDHKQNALRLPPLAKGRYLKESWGEEIERLRKEIDSVNPYIIVALGAEALWALYGRTEITALRGTLFKTIYGQKAIATFHPSYVLQRGRQPRNICVSDLIKARTSSYTREIEYPDRTLYLNPDIQDLWDFRARFLDGAELIFIDIETDPVNLRQITSIAFASSPREGLCVPFSFANQSYWPTLKQEVEAIKFVKEVCALPTAKALQNGLYDLHWLWTEWRVRVRNYLHDTRLLHYSLFPELQKDLGFIGSLWANEGAWKQLGKSQKDES